MHYSQEEIAGFVKLYSGNIIPLRVIRELQRHRELGSWLSDCLACSTNFSCLHDMGFVRIL